MHSSDEYSTDRKSDNKKSCVKNGAECELFLSPISFAFDSSLTPAKADKQFNIDYGEKKVCLNSPNNQNGVLLLHV